MEVVAKFLMLVFLVLLSSLGLFFLNRGKRQMQERDREGPPDTRRRPGQPFPEQAETPLTGFSGQDQDPLYSSYARAIALLRMGKAEEAVKPLEEATRSIAGHEDRRVAKHVLQLLISLYEDSADYFRSLQTVEMALSYFPGDRGFTKDRQRLIRKISDQAMRPH